MREIEEEKQEWRNFATPVLARIGLTLAIIAFVFSLAALLLLYK